MKMTKRKLLAIAATAALTCVAGTAQAQETLKIGLIRSLATKQ